MSNKSEKKSRILYLKQYLEEYADELHPAVTGDILEHLSSKGIMATRKTVTQDIDLLIEAGVDVVCNKSRQNQYFIGDRHFELPELKLLIDATQASKFLTAKRSRKLIGKLLALAGQHQRDDLAGGLYFDDYVKPKNESAYLTADLLLSAIGAGKRVRFKYFEYSPEKKREYKHGQRIYEFSPWCFVWDNDKYYILGHSKHHGKAVTFRIDRIASPKLTALEAVPTPDDFDLAAYMTSTFQMYDGAVMNVTLQCANFMMDTIIDRFGENVQTGIVNTTHFHTVVSVSASKTFYGWVFGMDGAVVITAPDEAVKAYADMLNRAIKPPSKGKK